MERRNLTKASHKSNHYVLDVVEKQPTVPIINKTRVTLQTFVARHRWKIAGFLVFNLLMLASYKACWLIIERSEDDCFWKVTKLLQNHGIKWECDWYCPGPIEDHCSRKNCRWKFYYEKYNNQIPEEYREWASNFFDSAYFNREYEVRRPGDVCFHKFRTVKNFVYSYTQYRYHNNNFQCSDRDMWCFGSTRLLVQSNKVRKMQ